jgi:uncharacterized ferritin-like protein (DUF455 family)
MPQFSPLAQQVQERNSLREPPYRPLPALSADERAVVSEKLGDAGNFEIGTLRDLAEADPENMEFRKALVCAVASAEFAGVDAFSRKVVEWQDWRVPPELIMAMARQTWDEVRHAQLALGLLDSYGGRIDEYPDTLGGGTGNRDQLARALGDDPSDPLISLETTNVALEGAALTLFSEMSELGARIGDPLMQHVYDYNWADEVTHTAIGDYFVRRLCADDPQQEQRALRVHARYDSFRAGLSQTQQAEIRDFFAEEDDRASMVLG